MKKKILVSVAAAALVLCCVIGGTLAWLTDRTDSVVNTFAVGNVDITLGETTTAYKMVPGYVIEKDPKVSVKAGSEDCWLFVKVDKSENFDNFMAFDMASGWTALNGENGVFYREVKTVDTNREFPVLKDNQVTVKDIVVKEQMDELTEATKPTLTFTAYAVQQYKSNTETFSPAEAWETVSIPAV